MERRSGLADHATEADTIQRVKGIIVCDARIVATDSRDSSAYPLDFQTVHEQGVPHRSVHLEITNDQGDFFVWQRADGRLEILGGHVDWLEGQNRPESYEEAALRELTEELNLLENWSVDVGTANARLKERLSPIVRLVNQVPSSHGYNNEWVTVYELHWQSEWGDPSSSEWTLSEEGNSSRWLSVEDIERLSLEKPLGINAALRLFLRRRDILVPLTASTSAMSQPHPTWPSATDRLPPRPGGLR